MLNLTVILMTSETTICTLPGPLLHWSTAAKPGRRTVVADAVTDPDADADADADTEIQQTATVSAEGAKKGQN